MMGEALLKPRFIVLWSCWLLVAACAEADNKQEGASAVENITPLGKPTTCGEIADVPVRIEGGTFIMGQEEVYAEEGPLRETNVDTFWIDPHEVANRQFAAFVAATGYVTVAERPVDPAFYSVPVEQIPAQLLEPGSAVFTPPARPSRRYTD